MQWKLHLILSTKNLMRFSVDSLHSGLCRWTSDRNDASPTIRFISSLVNMSVISPVKTNWFNRSKNDSSRISASVRMKEKCLLFNAAYLQWLLRSSRRFIFVYSFEGRILRTRCSRINVAKVARLCLPLALSPIRRHEPPSMQIARTIFKSCSTAYGKRTRSILCIFSGFWLYKSRNDLTLPWISWKL